MARNEIMKKIKPHWLLWSAIVLYLLFFNILVLWKYSHFYYDNLDLGIFNNVFWNTLHGHFFEASIHPPSYFGDHFSPGILLLIPLYALAPGPQILLILQTIAIALSAIPIYLIAKRFTGTAKPWTPLFVSLLWLVNPITHNMNFFEFELMAFAVLGLLWVTYAYLEQKAILFVLVSVLTLGMREDFVFILCIFSVLALLEKRSLFWKWFPFLTSILWAVMAFSIIGLFAPRNTYKFLNYYGWLGGTDLFSTALSFISHPWHVLLHLTTWYNLEFVLGMLFPFFFFISFKNRYALLAIPPVAQIMLANFGGSGLILGIYYAGYLLGILFVLFAICLEKFSPDAMPRWIPAELRSRRVIYGLIALASLYATLTYGSVATAFSWWKKPHALQAKEHLLKLVPPNAPIATTYSLLGPLSNRRSVYLLPYAAVGKSQFALTDYALPEDTEYLLIDWDEMVLMQMHFSENPILSPYASAVPEHLRSILSSYSIVAAEDSLTLLRRDGSPENIAKFARLSPNSEITEGEPKITRIGADGDKLEVHITMPETMLAENYYYLELTYGEEKTRIPLAYGLYSTADLNSTGSLRMPLFIRPSYAITAELYRWTKGSIELTGIKSIHPVSDAELVDTFTYNPTR